jgi:hypothetical protein
MSASFPILFSGSMFVEQGTVYFVQAQGGPIKIGVTGGDVKGRLAGLRNGSPTELELRATMNGGRELERWVHEQFAEFRLHGEWFAPAPRLLEFVESLATNEPFEIDISHADEREFTDLLEQDITEEAPVVGARTKVARTRLNAAEYLQWQEGARNAGVSPSQYLRDLIVRGQEVPVRLEQLEAQVRHLQEQMAQKWLEEGREDE